MDLIDVNVLVSAINLRDPRHEEFKQWLENWLKQDVEFGISELVMSSVLRIATHPGILEDPFDTDSILNFSSSIINRPNCQLVRPGPQHWDIFTDLCRQTSATGNNVPDAYFAALAIEHDCEWLTADKGFSQFPGLRWRHPLER